MPRVCVRTLGCKVNRTESEALAERLLGMDVELGASAVGADLVVVNTCTVTGEADAKARKAVRRALAECAGPVVVTGCSAAIDPASLASLDPRVVVEPDRKRLAATIAATLGRRAVAVGPRSGPVFKTRVMVKVQDGCDHRCAYCIVPDARGGPVSVPPSEVIERVRHLHDGGAPEVVLTGVNVGRYAGESPVSTLGDLIEAVAATGIRRIRLSSIEPLHLTPVLLATLSRLDGFARHLHVPLQSGSDAVLSAMGRGYSTGDFRRVVADLRAALPGVSLTTDVMTGFPGETDDDHARSLSFIDETGFAKLHVFRYSKRAGTPAASMPRQVPPDVKAVRASELRGLSATLERTHGASLVGTITTVCVEDVSAGLARGMGDHSLPVRFAASEVVPGSLVSVRIDAAGESGLLGTMLESA